MPNRADRRTYFVDKKVQGALLARAARYWLLSVVVVASLTVLGWMFVTPGMGALIQLREHLPWLLGGLLVALIVSLCVLPVILYDLARLSNRFAGPMLRCTAQWVKRQPVSMSNRSIFAIMTIGRNLPMHLICSTNVYKSLKTTRIRQNLAN